jgi:single-strand DNA-binding protein
MAMFYEASVSLTGFVATQPTIRLVKTGVTNVSMRVAWTPRYFDRSSNEWVDGNTSYATVICWRKLATNAAVSLRRGDPVTVQGRLTVRDFEDKEGRPRTAVEIDATALGHDLSRGIATFQRLRPQTGMTAAEHAAAQRTAGQGDDGERANADAGSVNGASSQAGAGSGGEGWADGANGVPMPDEPGQSIFDESAISEYADSDEAAAAA